MGFRGRTRMGGSVGFGGSSFLRDYFPPGYVKCMRIV